MAYPGPQAPSNLRRTLVLMTALATIVVGLQTIAPAHGQGFPEPEPVVTLQVPDRALHHHSNVRITVDGIPEGQSFNLQWCFETDQITGCAGISNFRPNESGEIVVTTRRFLQPHGSDSFVDCADTAVRCSLLFNSDGPWVYAPLRYSANRPAPNIRIASPVTVGEPVDIETNLYLGPPPRLHRQKKATNVLQCPPRVTLDNRSGCVVVGQQTYGGISTVRPRRTLLDRAGELVDCAATAGICDLVVTGQLLGTPLVFETPQTSPVPDHEITIGDTTDLTSDEPMDIVVDTSTRVRVQVFQCALHANGTARCRKMTQKTAKGTTTGELAPVTLTFTPEKLFERNGQTYDCGQDDSGCFLMVRLDGFARSNKNAVIGNTRYPISFGASSAG